MNRTAGKTAFGFFKDGRLGNPTWRCCEHHLPTGKRLQKAIEQMAIEIVDFPIQNGGSFHSYVNVYQRVYTHFGF